MRSGGELDFLAVDVQRARVGKNFAADLHAGIQQGVAFVFQFQLEVAECLRRAKKTVARAGNRFADQHSVRDEVICLAAVLLPAIEIFPVKKIIQPSSA